ncbi:hypothetical protein C0Z18_17580 [Trinickia dabaoshanensis]|uniref:Uncharacterized protein n=1 Tax=Trinickia dabaoshanensis TaxID=564714 RepID=A0A2N7VMJ7_9BURK|nr:hypothetical protein [Trinickia dabaoshanensis]PMS18382.1 hypothetical protein C0Z18_17580 [Trinickia dabaoshanensis]
MNNSATVACLAIAIASSCCHAAALPDCLSTSDVSIISHDVFTDFPSRGAFEKFVDSGKFELLTNVADGAMLRRAGRPAKEKIDWLLGVFHDHEAVFKDMSGFERPRFSYMKGQLRGKEPSVDDGRTTTTFPKHECVREVTYRATGRQCVMSQELSNLSLTFIKDEQKLKLATVELFFVTCSETGATNR